MTVLMATFQSIATLFCLGVIGFYIINKKMIPENILGTLSPLLLEIALPAMIFVKIATKFELSSSQRAIEMVVCWIAFTAFTAIFVKVFRLFSSRKNRSEFALCLFFQNAIFFPLIIINELYGSNSDHIVNLFFFTILYAPLSFNFYKLFFKNSEKNKFKFDLKRWMHPTLWATIVAVLIGLLQIKAYVPKFAIQALTMVGGMTLPLLMLIVGGNLYIDYKNQGKVEWYEVFKFIIIKNFLYPFLCLGLLILIKAPFYLSLMIILQSAAPPLTALPLFAERAGGNKNVTNQFLVGSFITSIISLPAVLAAFNYFFTN